MRKANTMNTVKKLPIKSNFHTHTTRCRHASGTDKEYVEAAINAGIKILGFSDHTPYPTGTNFKSGMRISLDETDGYFSSISSLKKEYASDIKIYIGLEAEYFPEYFHKLTEYLKDYPLDYMILGEHFVPDEEHGFYVGGQFTDYAPLELYTKYVLEAMETGCFSYVAHPDLPYYIGNNSAKLLTETYEKICVKAKELNIPLEINCLGNSRSSSIYPCDSFLDIAARTGNDMIIGLDAHSPEQFYNYDNTLNCVNKAKSRKLHLIDTLPFCE